MQLYSTERIDIIVGYNLLSKISEGKIFSKIEKENPVVVGHITEKNSGDWELRLICSSENDREYVVEDCKELKPMLNEYADMWRERNKRGVC